MLVTMNLICMPFFRKVHKNILAIVFLLISFSCSGPYMGKEIYGADEFVLDSYRIKEGKLSILEMEGEEPSELSDELLEEYKDEIHEDDILQISLFHPTRQDLVAAVDKIGQMVGFHVVDGKIHLPDLDPIYVSGLTLDEARERIQGRYLDQVENVEVFITYKKRMVRKVELAGLVSVSSVPVNGKIRLFDVISMAHVPANANLFKSYVIRNQTILPVDFYKLLIKGDMSQNIVMRGGDKIYIAEPGAASLMVMGEVGCPSVLPLPYGFMSLRHALASAGGIPYTGDKSYIQVIRGNITNPKIYTLSWEHVIHLPNSSLLLMPGDIVYVASTPITEWNRFISQLMPSFAGLEAVNRCGGMILP